LKSTVVYNQGLKYAKNFVGTTNSTFCHIFQSANLTLGGTATPAA